jgi:Gpi18-like mannosyltransferase
MRVVGSPVYLALTTGRQKRGTEIQKHNVVFFPLFPLLIHGLMLLGIPPQVAGTVVNNLAFIGALGILYSWAEECHSISAARWATAVLAWSPFSLFGTVIYTEGLFLLLTTAALRSFDKRQHAWAAVWGSMATATRVPGAALIPAFLFVAWRERRPAIAYVAGLAVGGGLLLFSGYCLVDTALSVLETH